MLSLVMHSWYYVGNLRLEGGRVSDNCAEYRTFRWYTDLN